MRKAIRMIRKTAAFSICFAFIAGCASCSVKPQRDETASPSIENATAFVSETPTDQATPEQTSADSTPEDALMSAFDAYRDVLSSADQYDYGCGVDEFPSSYRYALVFMCSDDTVPALLVGRSIEGQLEYLRVFIYDVQTKKVNEPAFEDPAVTLRQGAASVGGFRGSLEILDNGTGLCFTQFYSGTGDATVDRITAQGDILNCIRICEGRIDELTVASHAIGNWYDISDESGFDAALLNK